MVDVERQSEGVWGSGPDPTSDRDIHVHALPPGWHGRYLTPGPTTALTSPRLRLEGSRGAGAVAPWEES